MGLAEILEELGTQFCSLLGLTKAGGIVDDKPEGTTKTPWFLIDIALCWK